MLVKEFVGVLDCLGVEVTSGDGVGVGIGVGVDGVGDGRQMYAGTFDV